jgi:hypothetical protein
MPHKIRPDTNLLPLPSPLIKIPPKPVITLELHIAMRCSIGMKVYAVEVGIRVERFVDVEL